MTVIKEMVLLCLLLSVVCPLLAYGAQPYTPVHPDPVLESWRWSTYPELNGLGVVCMAEGQDGTMWFGVRDGVVRYDGLTWTTYTPEDGLYGAPVTSLLAGRNGLVYAGTNLGISRLSDGQWQRIFPEDGAAWRITDLLKTSDGGIWAATEWGGLRLDKGKAEVFTSEDLARTLRSVAPGVTPIVVPDGIAPARPWSERTGIAASGGGMPVIQALADGSPGRLAGLQPGDRIVEIDGNRPLLAALEGAAGTSVTVTVRRHGSASPVDYTLTRGEFTGTFRGFDVFDVMESQDGAIWFSLWGTGDVVRYAPRTDEWRLIPSGLDRTQSVDLQRLAQAQDGRIWSSRPLRFLSSSSDSIWETPIFEDQPYHVTGTSILAGSDGKLWVGRFGGILSDRSGRWSGYGYREAPLPSVRVTQILETIDGSLWVLGRHQKVVRLALNTTRWTTYAGLRFACDSHDGSRWFLAPDGEVVRQQDGQWTRYGIEDGLMNRVGRLITTRTGEVWAAGNHQGPAATARLEGDAWNLELHPRLGQMGGVFEDSRGHLWFAAFREQDALGGILRFVHRSENPGDPWTHYPGAVSLPYIYGIGESADGDIWIGNNTSTRRFREGTWTSVAKMGSVRIPPATYVYRGHTPELWLGHRTEGVHSFDGTTWTAHNAQHGIPEGNVVDILQTSDGSVWVSTLGGVARYDGQSWTLQSYLQDLIRDSRFGNLQLEQDRDGAIWINTLIPTHQNQGQPEYQRAAIRYVPDALPPETEIILGAGEVSQPGNTTIAWSGIDPWKGTERKALQFAYRLNSSSGQPNEWSAFSTETNHIYQSLDSGDYTFEVKARDQDFNEDPTPALLTFTVLPPVWQQGWFIGMVLVFVSGIAFQTTRVLRRDRRLREANQALSDANNELFRANQEISAQSERKSAFLASMSHELRTPMNAIKGFTNLVIRRGKDQPWDRSEANLQKVSQASDHLLAQIDDLLDLSKIEAGRMDVSVSEFDVREAIEYCVSTVSPLVQEGVELSASIDASVGTANTDEQRVRQMVINLLSNAVKFTDAGSVRVSVRKLSAESGAQSAGQTDQLEISVADTGKGIPEAELPTLFDEYRQVVGQSESEVQRGTGLGLSITKRFAELLGGSIEVESEVGKGSTFTVRIPMEYAVTSE